MRAREALSKVAEGVGVSLKPDFVWPDDWYEVSVWKLGDTYFMQLHDELEPISDSDPDGSLILANMTSYNGDWEVGEIVELEGDRTCPICECGLYWVAWSGWICPNEAFHHEMA